LAISNPCARLIANAIIFYNSAILSRLLTKYEASGNAKARALITPMSPAAWRHILLNGHYTFHSDGKMIDLDALVAELGGRNFRRFRLITPRCSKVSIGWS
jgi:Tn3 transposase DDE domain